MSTCGLRDKTHATVNVKEPVLPARSEPPERPASPPFWRAKPLEALDEREWESLCDGCGRCCLVKLEDAEDGDIYVTNVACRLFDAQGCRCADYRNRQALVPDCVKLDPAAVRALPWLPPTCAYRLVAEGRDLYWWHPLVSGDPETVHQAGMSVRGRVGGREDEVAEADLPDHIVAWPMQEG